MRVACWLPWCPVTGRKRARTVPSHLKQRRGIYLHAVRPHSCTQWSELSQADASASLCRSWPTSPSLAVTIKRERCGGRPRGGQKKDPGSGDKTKLAPIHTPVECLEWQTRSGQFEQAYLSVANAFCLSVCRLSKRARSRYRLGVDRSTMTQAFSPPTNLPVPPSKSEWWVLGFPPLSVYKAPHGNACSFNVNIEFSSVLLIGYALAFLPRSNDSR